MNFDFLLLYLIFISIIKNIVANYSITNLTPNKRKLKDSGLVKSSKILIGNKIGVGCMYRAKYPMPFLLMPA
jgi:hypothetical protein